MQTTVSDAGPMRKQLTISIPAEEVKARRNELLDRYAGQVRLKGFRPGKKPPRSMVEKRLGPGFNDEVFQGLVDEAVSKGLKDNELKPIGQFAIDESSREGDITHVISFDVQPEFELPEPSSIPVTLSDTDVSDEDMDKELEDLSKRSGSYTELTAEDNLAKDDIVTLSGSVKDGETVIRDVQELQHMVGSYPLFGIEPADVEAKITGLKVGEALEVETTLPDNFTPEEYAGKDAQASLTIQSARRMAPAELNDEIAQRFGLQSLDELKDRVRSSIEARKQDEVQTAQSEEILAYLVDELKFDLPETLFKEVLDQRIKQEEAKVEANKEKEPDATVDEEALKAEVEKDLRRHLINENMADTLKVEITQEDMQQQISMAAYQSGQKPEDVAKQLQESGRVQQVAAEIRAAKALAMFIETVVKAHTPDDENSEAEASDE